MTAEGGPRARGQRRLLLALVLATIGVTLTAGGVLLLREGGSAYYLCAGLLVVLAAILAARGDRRTMAVYALLLLGTLVWAIWESGGDAWALQARLAAPLVLGLWVFWPWLARIGMKRLAPLAALLVAGSAALLAQGLRNEPPSSATTGDAVAATPVSGEWPHYGNDQGGRRYSPLRQITPQNVTKLDVAWTFRTGYTGPQIGFEVTPLMVGGTLYLCRPDNVIFALDAETGVQRWRFDPKVNPPPLAACRGVAYHAQEGATGACARRIIFATTDARLMAVDAADGRLCQGFGAGGTVDLKRGMGEIKHGYYYVSSAPALVRGKAVVGGWVWDNREVGEPSGVIRAFDAVTGALAWAWDMDRPDDPAEPPPGQTYSRGTANSWAPMSGDEELGLVYVPTGNATPDYWAGKRTAASDKYGSAVVALDAQTGRARWVFQTVHHDLWDYDVASQPTLVDLPINGQTVPALIQPTKQGQVYLLDRRTGTPLARVEERPVPQGAAPGDYTAPTQPYSVGMPMFDQQEIAEHTMWGVTPLDQLWCRLKFREARYDGPYTPPGVRPNIFYPSYAGGMDWGGVAVDPDRRLMVVNWTRIANYSRLIPRAEADRQGEPGGDSGHGGIKGLLPQTGAPFAAQSEAFLSPLGVPCTQPPFGKIAVVDLDARRILWQRPLGTSADSGPFYLRSRVPLPMGMPNLGGSVVTRGGLVFIGAARERRIRAFELRTGRQVWSHALPRGGHATPMTYYSPKSGRQFVVIAAGGILPLQSEQGDFVVAFALPAGHAAVRP